MDVFFMVSAPTPSCVPTVTVSQTWVGGSCSLWRP